MLYLISLLLAAALGFAAHRASLCSVRAVAEVLSNRRAWVLASFAKTALWAVAVGVPILWLWPAQAMIAKTYAVSLVAVAGGFMFGVGATLNGGCAFSTLAHLADGELYMLASIAGFCAGISGWYAIDLHMLIPPPQPLPMPMVAPGPGTGILLAMIWLWGAWELTRLWRLRDRDHDWRGRICAPRYRLSTAALLIGVASGILYALHGAWTYTTVLKRSVEAWLRPEISPSMLLLALFLALLSGMVLSSWQRGGFLLRWRGDWGRRFLGGLLMGLGGAVIPGGNDELILRAIPMLSPHALPAYLALLAGIAVSLSLLGLVRGEPMKVACSGDVCRSD